MSTPGVPGSVFPPAELKLGSSWWTRQNPGSTVTAVYQCADFPAFHITLFLGTPPDTTSCSQVHATPNLPVFQNLHVWYGGDHNFHGGAEHFLKLKKQQRDNAHDWYKSHQPHIADLLTTAYEKLWAAKNAAYPVANPPVVTAQTATKPKAEKWEAAQKTAGQSSKQHQAEVHQRNEELRQVRELLDYASANFPDAEPAGKTVEFVYDYRKWSVPLSKVVTVWAPNKDKPGRIPQTPFTSLLSSCSVSALFFLHGDLKGAGRVAYAVDPGHCSALEFDVSTTDPVTVALRRQQKRLAHLEDHVVEPAGYAVDHVYLLFAGGSVPAEGWYAFDPGLSSSTAHDAAIGFKVTHNKLPRCVVRLDPDGTEFCPVELLTFVTAGSMDRKTSGTLEYPVPQNALTGWVKSLPRATYDAHTGTLSVGGLQTAFGHLQTAINTGKVTYKPEEARREYRMPAYFVTGGKSKEAFFDLSGLNLVPPAAGPAPKQAKLPQAKYDSGHELLVWPDTTKFPLPQTVLRTLPKISPEDASPDQCVRIGDAGVVYLLDLYEATPSCTVLGRLGDLIVLECPRGLRVATHVLPACETCDDVMVMDGGFIGWINGTVAYPLREYLLEHDLVITDGQKVADLTDADGRKWWHVKVQGTECWVGEHDLQQVVTRVGLQHDLQQVGTSGGLEDDLLLYEWVQQSRGAGIVLIVDDHAQTWLTNPAALSAAEPKPAESPSAN
ncbi:hypothetical protein OG439_07960 [Amycolatopsis sp. NBC_01307]|uniref:hypothetical protein n=1 Tax=Amycolatopsis sp. NBC_01307 TaxID=2903561 RepID=UPI002E15237B|nr:hypothetical protein OG439_07960 [Amycolatopsis sp. NBC_01307]